MKKFTPLRSRKLPKGVLLKDAEPYMVIFQDQEVDLHEVLLFYMKDSLQIAIEELGKANKNWKKQSLDGEAVFANSIDLLKSLKRSLGFANIENSQTSKTL